VAQYLLGFHAKWVKKKMRDDFFEVFGEPMSLWFFWAQPSSLLPKPRQRMSRDR
jgi:hypothetical protein